ncbi:MAG: hypothetical protein J1E56_01200 [Ruminococcus sp.]|nr:hypothetical protein [Ruminococcus sp.]
MDTNSNINSENTYSQSNNEFVEDLSAQLQRQSRRYSKPFDEEGQASIK